MGKTKSIKRNAQRKKEEQEVLKDLINIVLLKLVAKLCFFSESLIMEFERSI